jgi:hypothetical protein
MLKLTFTRMEDENRVDQKRRKRMFTKSQFRFVSKLLTALLAGLLLVPACSPAAPTTTLPSPTATPAPLATSEPTVVPNPDGAPHLSLDTGSVATGFQTETVAAVPPNANSPYWEILPEYTRVTLDGYPESDHFMKPQIFIYPVEELGQFNEGAAAIAASLQTLLQSPQEVENMPFLPLFNAQQVLHAQLQYLDFQNGQGLRYLTEFSQGIVPINNSELFYTYQGLTSDGKYYVAAILPVTHPSLPADGTVTGNEPPEFTSDFLTYLANVVASLNPQAASTFTPDLTQLDAMMSSLEIE